MRASSLCALLIAGLPLLVIPTAPAQCTLDGSFEGQTTGGMVGGFWFVDLGTNTLVLDDTTSQGFFPTHGTKYIRIDPGANGGAVPGHGPHAAGTVGKVSQTFAVPAHEFFALAVDWDWAPKENLGTTTFNDFLSIDLVDNTVSPPVLIANLVYIDTNNSFSAPYTNVPGAGPGTSGLTYVPNRLLEPAMANQAPAGFKRSWTDLTGVVTAGQMVTLEIAVGNAGDDEVDSAAFIDRVCALLAERNTYDASLRLLGSPHQNDVFSSSDFGGDFRPETPFDFFAMPGQALVFRAGTINAGVPWALVMGTIETTGVFLAPIGTVNLNLNLPILPVIDGIAVGGGDDLLGTIDNDGVNFLEAFVGMTVPAGTHVGFQAVMISPLSPFGFELSAATEVSVAGPGVHPRMPQGTLLVTQANTGGTDVGSGAQGDDGATSLDLTYLAFGAGTFPFYGAAYPNLWVGSNGYLTFGGSDTTYSESETGMLTGPARIAAVWDDLIASPSGGVFFDVTGTTLTVSWDGVREYGQPVAGNRFAVELYADGQFTLYWASTTMADGLTGVSPGGLAPPAPGAVASLNWSTQLFTGGDRGAILAGTAFFERFRFADVPGLFRDTFDLFTLGSRGAPRIHFVPDGVGGYEFFTGTR